jgi:hypothetical protein
LTFLSPFTFTSEAFVEAVVGEAVFSNGLDDVVDGGTLLGTAKDEPLIADGGSLAVDSDFDVEDDGEEDFGAEREISSMN